MDSLVLSRAQMRTFGEIIRVAFGGRGFLAFKYLGSRLPEIGPRSSQLSVASLHLCDIRNLCLLFVMRPLSSYGVIIPCGVVHASEERSFRREQQHILMLSLSDSKIERVKAGKSDIYNGDTRLDSGRSGACWTPPQMLE